jgi:hypothetical protein
LKRAWLAATTAAPDFDATRGRQLMVERMTPRSSEGGRYKPAFAETHSGLVFFVGDRA